MSQRLLNFFYQPILFFFLLPVLYMALGVIYSIPFDSIRIFSILMFYSFILINQMLENMSFQIFNKQPKYSKKFFWLLECFNLLAIVYFGWRYSWTASLVLLGYTLIIQLQFLLDYYDLKIFSVSMATLFKVYLLNGFAFYIGTNFMHVKLLPVFSGLFFPIFLLEASRMGKQIKKQVVLILLALGYLLSLLILWNTVGTTSLVILATLPLAWLVYKETNRQTASTFSVIHSTIYIISTIQSFL